MTEAGLAAIDGQIGHPDDPFQIPAWIEDQLKADPVAWENFRQFPHHYKRLKISWIADVKGDSRREEAQKRLDYLIKMSRQGKQYGTVP